MNLVVRDNFDRTYGQWDECVADSELQVNHRTLL